MKHAAVLLLGTFAAGFAAAKEPVVDVRPQFTPLSIAAAKSAQTRKQARTAIAGPLVELRETRLADGSVVLDCSENHDHAIHQGGPEGAGATR